MSETQSERPKVGVGVIVLRDEKVLIGERIASHGAGTFCIPGGHMEFGESFEQTAKREVEEETGLTNLEFKAVTSIVNDIAYSKHYVAVGILVESLKGEAFNAEPDKSQNWKWYDPSEIPENLFNASKKILENWLEGRLYSD